MSGRDISLGAQSFRTLRENNYVYIDKTGFIKELLSGPRAEVSLITRPRRFGKSLLLNMLMEFFDRTKDSRNLFDGLAISKDKELCAKWMNKYPVIYLSLNEIKEESFDESYEAFVDLSADLCMKYSFLLNSSKVGEFHKTILRSIMTYTADNAMFSNILIILCEAIYQDCGIKPIILIDEYDAPLAKIKGDEDYNKMTSFIGTLFETGLKNNDYFQFAILTGCLRIAKESFFTGLNNFKCAGINDEQFADKFGFTHNEVQSLFAEQGFSDKIDILQEWYDGYCFGSNHFMYCPWDVMNYLYDLKVSPNARPKTYWKNTSSNEVVEYFLYNYMEKLDDKITTLLNHGCIDADIKEDLTYKTLYDTEDNLWTLLYLTGYLTKTPADTEEEEDTMLELRIPNKEIFTIFTQTIESVFRRRIDGNESLDPLYDAFWKRDDDKVTEILSDLFLTTMSFHDYYEVYYHAILVGVFKQKYKHTTSNYESGLGRADIIVKDRANKRAAVIEVKKPHDTKESLSSAADRALRQIADMKYDAPLQGDYSVILHWGIACQDKSCVVKSVAG